MAPDVKKPPKIYKFWKVKNKIMKYYLDYTEIKKLNKKNELENLKDRLEKVKTLTIESLNNNYYFCDLLTSKQKGLKIAEIKKILVEKLKAESNKKILNFNNKCDVIASSEFGGTIEIKINWVKNRTWGYNPTAEVWSSGIYTIGRASGCGYDKRSTAVAEAFNKNNAILKLIYNQYEKALRKNKNVDLREAVGYGSGYRGHPSFDGGVGYGCYRSIFEKIGAKTNTWSEGKTWDYMLIEF